MDYTLKNLNNQLLLTAVGAASNNLDFNPSNIT